MSSSFENTNEEFLLNYFERLSAHNAKIYPEDYMGEDGLIYCHKCHTPKQSRQTWGGKEHIVTHLCECQSKARDEYEAKKRLDSFMIEQAHRKSVAFPDGEYRDWTFDLDDGADAHASKVCKAYAENFRKMYASGKGLMLYGDIGTGKSFLAASVVNYVMDNFYYPCLVTNMTRIGSAVQRMNDPQSYLDTLNEYDLLVLDDLRSERDTPWMAELAHSVINARYMSGKPIIVTTNLTKNELVNPEDRHWQRTYSRLFEMCLPLQMSGKDRRKETLRKDAYNMMEMLGLTGDSDDTRPD